MESICKLKDIYKALYEFEANFLGTYGVTINEGIIMCMLMDGAKKAGEICADCSLTASRLSKVLASLESKMYICRSIGNQDRRQIMVELTAEGLQKVTSIKSSQVCIPDALSILLK